MTKSLFAALLLLLPFLFANTAQAQRAHRTRRESNANRQARIARTIQETYGHRWEAAGGGGYLRFRSGPFLQQNNEVTFFGAAQYALTPKIGAYGEVVGAYGDAKIGTNQYLNSFQVGGFRPQISEYIFTVGPSYRIRARERYAVTGYITGGYALGKFDGDTKGFTSAEVSLWQAESAAAFTAGVNFDYNFYPNLAMRVTPKYVGTVFDGTVQQSKGFNLGLVYRFGKVK